MLICDEVPTKASALGAQVIVILDNYGSNSDYKGYGMGQILLIASESLQKESEKELGVGAQL